MGLTRYNYYYRKGKIKTLERFNSVVPNLVSIWLDKVRQHPYFDEFECYLFGSLLYQDKSGDMDIFFTGEYLPDLLIDLMDYSLQMAMDLKIKADIFYIPDYSYLDYPAHYTSDKLFETYTTYDHEIMIEKGKVILFRDYGVRMKDGLFRSTQTQYHQKSVERKAPMPRYRKLN
tara:strand:+ start:358 stop:879 length:522 start_codon:yes stop_codon:yes gene_type:complete